MLLFIGILLVLLKGIIQMTLFAGVNGNYQGFDNRYLRNLSVLDI